MKRSLIITIVVVGAIALSCAGLFLIASKGMTNTPRNTEKVTVVIEKPDSVVVGQEFDFVIIVTDTSGSARRIPDVEFHDPLLDGVTITSVEPPAQVLVSALDPSATYTMNAPVHIPARGTATITFKCTATRPGNYNASISVRLDGVLISHTVPTTIVVTPKP